MTMPAPNRDAMLRLRAEWKAQGLCSRCGCDREDERWALCRHCRQCGREAWRARNTPLARPGDGAHATTTA